MLRKLCICSLLLALSSPAWALFTWTPEGGWSNDWEELAATDMQQYTQAYESLEAKKYKRAHKQFGALIKNFPDSKLVEKAMYYQGVAQLKNREYWKAFASLELYIKTFPNAPKTKEAFAHQFDIARAYQDGAKRPLPLTNWKVLPAKEDAITIYEKIIKEDPFGAFGARAQFEIARVHEGLDAFESAIDSYNRVIDHYGDSSWATKARYRKSIVFQAMNKGADYNKKTLNQAVENLTLYETTLKNEDERNEIRKTIDDINKKTVSRLTGTAEYYKRIGKPKAAKIYYTKIISRFPDTDAAAEATKQIKRLENSK